MENYRLIKDPKERLFSIMERIEYLQQFPTDLLTIEEKLELENLEVLKMHAWSDWKDPKD